MSEQITNEVVEEQTNTEVIPIQNTAAKTAKVCPKCNADIADGQKFCGVCGCDIDATQIATQPLRCFNCGIEVAEDTKFCQNCGKEIMLQGDAYQAKKKPKKKMFLILAGIALVLVTAIVAMAIIFSAPKKIPVESVVLSETEIEIKEEETQTITCVVYPEDSSEKTVVWLSSDEKIATVDNTGKITAVKEGICTISATADGKSVTVNVTVIKKGPDFKKLYEEIDSDVKYGWELGADGSYLMADTNVYDLDDYSSSSIWYAIKDMNEKLGLPKSLDNDMAQTTWSMGRQNETFESVGIEVTWTYHPDKGMEVTYKLIYN